MVAKVSVAIGEEELGWARSTDRFSSGRLCSWRRAPFQPVAPPRTRAAVATAAAPLRPARPRTRTCRRVRRARATYRATTTVSTTASAVGMAKRGRGSARSSTASASRPTRHAERSAPTTLRPAASISPATPTRIARRGSTVARRLAPGEERARCAVSAARVMPGLEGPTRPARSEGRASRSLPESPTCVIRAGADTHRQRGPTCFFSSAMSCSHRSRRGRRSCDARRTPVIWLTAPARSAIAVAVRISDSTTRRERPSMRSERSCGRCPGSSSGRGRD